LFGTCSSHCLYWLEKQGIEYWHRGHGITLPSYWQKTAMIKYNKAFCGVTPAAIAPISTSDA